MASFSITDAALEGIRVTRERPLAVVVWAVLYFVAGLASSGLMMLTVGPQFATLKAASLGPNTTPAQAMAMLHELAPFYAVIVPFTLVFQSILICAVYRAVLRPGEGAPSYLKLGRDEGRMVVLSLLMILVAAAVLFTAMFIDTFATLALQQAFGQAGMAGAALISLVSLCAVVWVAVRLSLAAPMTFTTGRVSLFRAWPLTHNRFWMLFGAYVLANILAVIIFVLSLIVFIAIAGSVLILTGGALADVGRVFEPSAKSIAANFTPAIIVYQLFMALLWSVLYAIVLAPSAVAYTALSSGGAVDVVA
jgi:hypothetical protein